ncbi:MAG: NAD(P)-dependent oxidoreductase, partial [Deltaproteobacteria bacterium]|nr:NAD(P)-dependent oxidoreductase [Deltaproteobacteria bacterium]MBW2129025.1 NAD(P)-dependent oxidoreductase [Deltaproteobacteria bacterium]
MRIGWIGTGVMGAPMAGHLQAAGHELFIFNRTRKKAESLLDGGARWCESPAEVAARSEAVFTIIGFPEDVEAVYLGEQGIFSERGSCTLAVDMTTSRPSLARTLAAEGKARGIACLDAPVSGGDIGARNATLAIMVGGEREAFEQALPILKLMGKNISYMGGPGAGQHTKMCNQILIAGTMIGVCESLLYAVRAGLGQQAVIDIIGKGAAGSWSINNLGPRIVQGDFDPGFMVEHFIKDMGIALKEAADMNL